MAPRKKVTEKPLSAKPQSEAPPARQHPRLKVVISDPASTPGAACKDSLSAFGLVARELEQEDREVFIVLHLDNKRRLLAKEVVAIGSQSAATVHPREVFKGAVLNGSASIVCVHNHPSGDPSPGVADTLLTSRLVAAGDILGIEVADHIIIGKNCGVGYFSFVDAGMWPTVNALGSTTTAAAEQTPTAPCICHSEFWEIAERLHDVHAKAWFIHSPNWEFLGDNKEAQRGYDIYTYDLAKVIEKMEEDVRNLAKEKRPAV